MIKVKILNPESSESLGNLCDRNRDYFNKFFMVRDRLRDYSIDITDSDDYDFLFIGMSDFINKKIPLQDSVDKALENLSKITGDYFLFDGSDSSSLMGAYEVFSQSNAIYLLKNQMMRNREDYNTPYAFGKWFFGSGSDLDLSYDIPEDMWNRIKLSGVNIAFNRQNQYREMPPINKNKSVDIFAVCQYDHPFCEDHKVRNDLHYTRHRKSAVDMLDNKFSSYTERLPYNEYLQALYNSKVTVSPYGMGEICFRDFESMQVGTILIKPDQSRIISKPDVYIENETYIPCKLDFSDLNEKIQYVLDNFDELNEKINLNFRNKFIKEYHPDELCLYWYNMFSNLSSINKIEEK